MKKCRIISVSFLLFLFSPGLALAASGVQYTTWGGYDAVTQAFNFVANVFANQEYNYMFSGFALLGTAFGAFKANMEAVLGRGSVYSWVLHMLVGAALYFGLFVPTQQLYVYDNVLNETSQVYNLPMGMVQVAYLANLLEQFAVTTFDTAAGPPPSGVCGQLPPLNYADLGGSVGPYLMPNATSSYITDSTASASMVAYVQTCVKFAMQQDNSSMTQNIIMNPGCGMTILDAMQYAALPAVPVTTYVNAPSADGISTTCDVAYNTLYTYYTTDANAGGAIANACANTGIADVAQCQSIISNTLQNGLQGQSMTLGGFIGANTAALYANQAMLTEPNLPEGATYYAISQQNQQGVQGGLFTSIVNPIQIDAYLAYVISVMPIIILFIVTPLWKPAFTLVGSMFFFCALVRSLDVVTFHNWATAYQKALAAASSAGGLGVAAAMQLPLQSNKYLGQFANNRSGVFLFATLISGALWKFGDSALSRLSATMSKSKDTFETNPGKAALEKTEEAAQKTVMTQALAAGVHGSYNLGQGLAANKMADAGAGDGRLKAAPGHDMNGVQQQAEDIAEKTTRSAAGRASQLTAEQSSQAGQVAGAQDRAMLDGLTAAGGGKTAVQQAYDNAETNTEKNSTQMQTFKAEAGKLAKELNISEPEAMNKLAAFGGISATAATASYWEQKGGGVDNYKKFQENTAALSKGDQDGLLQVAQAVGKDAYTFSKDSSQVNNLQKAGILQAVDRGEISQKDLMDMGRAGILTDAGKMDAWKDLTKGSENPLQVQQELQKNLESGNSMPVRKSDTLATAMGALVGVSATQVQNASEDQYQKYSDTAKSELAKGQAQQVDPRIAQAISQTGPGMSIRGATAMIESHGIMANVGKAEMTEKIADTFFGGHDPEKLLHQYRSQAGIANGVLDKQSAAALNKQLPGANFKSGDNVTFAMGADGKIHMANAARGGFAEDKSGHTTERFSNTVVNSLYDQISGRRQQSMDINNSTRERIHSNQSFDISKIATKDGLTSEFSYKDAHGNRVVVSGSTEGQITKNIITPDGKAASMTVDPRSGQTVLTNLQSGEHTTWYNNATDIQFGTRVSGTLSNAVGKAAESVGFDAKSAEFVAGAGLDLLNDVTKVADTFGTAVEKGAEKARGGLDMIKNKHDEAMAKQYPHEYDPLIKGGGARKLPSAPTPETPVLNSTGLPTSMTKTGGVDPINRSRTTYSPYSDPMVMGGSAKPSTVLPASSPSTANITRSPKPVSTSIDPTRSMP